MEIVVLLAGPWYCLPACQAACIAQTLFFTIPLFPPERSFPISEFTNFTMTQWLTLACYVRETWSIFYLC